MSWSAPNCPHCPSPSPLTFEQPVDYGPSSHFCLGWVCERCKNKVLQLNPMGPSEPRPGVCLSCDRGELDDAGRCRHCAQLHAQLVTQVERECELPAQAEQILALRERGLYRLAFHAVDLRLVANPDDPEALALKGKLLVAVDRPEPAKPILRRAIELGADPEAQLNLGIALANTGHPREAIEVYERLLVEHPDEEARSFVLTNIGGCYTALGERDRAEAYHRRAVAADLENPGPRWNLFANLFGRGRVEEALAVLDEAVEFPFLDPDERANVCQFRSQMLAALGRLDEALESIDDSLRWDPNSAERVFARACTLRQLGRLNEARAALLRALELAPEFSAARDLLVKINRASGAASN
ncbi:Photosystem I assembly protein Ycf3 [Enhygromyxa salina]|uniref:Photosystem I assembly protein Ycf3 n=1 Tax=Enhygromyxa salina TaxID=215803 RepID=A0A2S9YD70_9BACT|nr:tetratricopeptide repeat protein [Enhygromyxa salina]PRQ03070.1 Photosystem I assembly protein Ycf3 [Enhygromyxa salina]